MATPDLSNAVWTPPPAAAGGLVTTPLQLAGQAAPASAGPDLSNAVWTPPPVPSSALGELGTAVARSALVGLPTSLGQAAQFLSSPGQPVSNFGAGMVASATQRGLSPSLTMQPEQHGGVVNALSGAIQGAGAFVPAAAAAAGGLLFPPLEAAVPALAAGGIAASSLEAGQETRNAVNAVPGSTLTQGRVAGLAAAGIAGVANIAGGAIFHGLVGAVTDPLAAAAASMVGKTAPDMASGIMDQLTGQAGSIMPALKSIPMTAAEVAGIGAGQAAGTAAVQQAYGVQGQSPLEAAEGAIPASLATGALLGLGSIPGRAIANRAAQARTAQLSDAATPAATRATLAEQYATSIEQPGTPAAQTAANIFRANAETAIQYGQPLQVDSGLFQYNAVEPTPNALDPDFSAPPQLGYDPNVMPSNVKIAFPDGSIANSPADAESYLANLPPDQAVGMRGRMFGFSQPAPEAGETMPEPATTDDAVAKNVAAAQDVHDQVKNALTAAGVTPTDFMTKDEFATATGLGGQKLVQSFRGYLNDPATEDAIMRDNAAKYDQLGAQEAAAPEAPTPSTESSAPPAQFNTELADKLDAALKQTQVDHTYAANEAAKSAQTDAIANITKGAQLADAAANGEIAPDANAPKAAAEIKTDVDAVNTAQDFSTKPQSMVPFQKRLDALGLDALPDHQAQIDAVQAALDDPKSTMSQPTRDRMSALLDSWKAEMPAETPEVAGSNAYNFTGKNGATYRITHDPDTQDVKAFDSKGKQVGYLEPAPLNNYQFSAENGAQAAAMHVNADQRRNGVNTALNAVAMRHVPGFTKESNMFTPDGQAWFDGAGNRTVDLQPELGTAQAEPVAADGSPAPDAEIGAVPPQAAALGDNIPAATPDNTAPPPQAEALADQLGENTPPTAHENARAAANTLDATLADFHQRIRNGEKLSPLEQERFEDAGNFRDTLEDVNNPKESPYSAEYAQQMADFANSTATPYTKSQRDGMYKVGSPSEVDPGIMAASAYSNKLSDTLGSLAEHGSTPGVRDYATKLQDLGVDATIRRAPTNDAVPDLLGRYDPTTNGIDIYPGGESEDTILHEATHAATAQRINQAEAIVTPRTQDEAKLKSAYNELEQIRQAAIAAGGDEYGLTNAHEFVAELHSNPNFQDFLKAQGTQKSLWSRAVDAVRKLLGLSTDDRGALEKAMTASETFFSKSQKEAAQEQAEFMKSPAGAGDAIDKTLARLAKQNDESKFNINKVDRVLYSKLLQWKTMQYIADRVRAVPEMVKYGFDKGVDAYNSAHESRRQAAQALGEAVDHYAGRVQKILSKTGSDDKARALSEELATIGGEASRGGFDYTKSFNDNLKTRPDLPTANKGYIDDIHRRFTQLSPEAQKALVDGETLGRSMLITRASTVARNLMDARAGVATRLASELQRMSPTDAARAALEARVTNAGLESTLAAVHSTKLDFMSKALQGLRNPDPSRFHDGAAAKLGSNLEEAFAAAKALPSGTPLRDHMAELENMYRAQINNPYFSLGRDGNYFVKVGFKNMDAATQAKLQAALKGTNKVLGNLMGGETHAFFRVDSAEEAAGLRTKLEAAAGDKTDMSQNASGQLSNAADTSSAGISTALRQLLGSLHDAVDNSSIKGAQADLMKQTINRELLSMLPETSSRSASMQRRGIPGYSADFLGNYGKRAAGAVQDTANIYTNPAFAAAAKQRTDAITALNRTGITNAKLRAVDVDNEINTRYANGMKPIDNSIVNSINSFGHTLYLAASPAFLIRTMAQPWHRGIPILGSRYGWVSSAKEMARATPTALKIMAASIKAGAAGGIQGMTTAKMNFRNMGLSPKEEAFIQELHDRGTLELGQAQQLQAMPLAGSRKLQDVTRLASMTAQYAEMTNRVITGLAAFRLAEKGTKDVAQEGTQKNTDYAIRAINYAMDNFDQSNTARAISKHAPVTGKITPLLTQFMNYNLQTMQQIGRTVHDGMFNQDTSPAGVQRSKEARREFGALMATTAMISGAMGLPFVNAFAGVYNSIQNELNPDQPGDIRIDAQNFLADTLGAKVGAVLSHGVGSALPGGGVDTSTFGLENLLPGSDFLASRQLLKDRIESQSQQLMGPAINGIVDLGLGLSKIADGHYVKGVEAMLPSGLKSYYKAVELATKGYTDSKGNPLPNGQATPWDIGLQGVGFQTAQHAQTMAVQSDQIAQNTRLKDRQNEITDEVYKSVTSGDPADQTAAIGKLQAYNQANPYQPIRDVASVIRQHMQELAIGNLTGMGVPETARQSVAGQQRYRFAAMPAN